MIAARYWEVPSWGTVTLVEAIWLFSGLMAIAFSIFHLKPLYDDYILARFSKRPALRLSAGAYFRREIIRFAQGICLTIVGVYACWVPNPLPGPAVVTVTGLILTCVLLLLSILVSAQSALDWRVRHEVQHLILEGQNGKHANEEH